MASRRTRLPALPRTRTTFPDKSRLPSLHDPTTQEVFQKVISNRKNWKTLRGGEVVWPLELEAALIEGDDKTFA
jgi:transcriptional enhancer factor